MAKKGKPKAGGAPKATAGPPPPDDVPARLQQLGVTHPPHYEAAEKAVKARGLDFGKVANWVQTYGPGVLEIVEELMKLRKGKGGG